MKRIGIVSDSHGKLHNLKRAVRNMGDVDLIIHVGDYIEDADSIRMWTNTPVMAVRGNMDSMIPDRPDFIKTEVEGHKLYIAHGHRQGVKMGPEVFAQAVKDNGCDIGIYGHTHRRDLERMGDVVLVNPGSCSLPNDGEKSYAILTLDGPNIDCNFYEVK